MSPSFFRPRSKAIIAATLLTLACGESSTEPSTQPLTILPGIAPVTTTSLSFTSEPGDWVGGGVPASYRVGDGAWTVWTERNAVGVNYLRVDFTANGGAAWWTLHLEAPKEQALRVGSYEAAHRWPFQALTAPGLDFSGSDRGCNELTGRFTIQELVYGPASRLDKLHVVFEQHCENGTPALRGEVSVAANPWR